MSKEFSTLSKSLVYENPWMQVYEHKILRRGREGIYGVVHREHSVIIIPLTPSRKTVLLKQYRYPTDGDSWELPMGGIGEAESEIEAAKRELCEETGLSSPPLVQIGSYYAVPGLTPQRVTVFVTDVTETDLLALAPPAESDDIQSGKVFALSEVYDMVSRGMITDGFTLVGLLYLRLFLEELP